MNCHQTADLRVPVGSSAARLKPGCWGHGWWMKWRQGGGLLWCVVLPSWASLGYGCFDTETRAKCLDFFFLPSWLSLWSNAALLCSVTGHGGQIEGGSGGGGEGGQRLPSEGLPNPPKALLERLPRPPKELERLKGSVKCQTGISKRGGWLAVLTPTPTRSTRLFSYKRAVVFLALPP